MRRWHMDGGGWFVVITTPGQSATEPRGWGPFDLEHEAMNAAHELRPELGPLVVWIDFGGGVPLEFRRVARILPPADTPPPRWPR